MAIVKSIEKLGSWPLFHYRSVASTMDVAARHFHSNNSNKFVVLADKQHNGRGKYGREWIACQGNFYATIAIRGEDPAKYHFLSYLASLSVLDALNNSACHGSAALKWPNDLLVNGQKVAGILLESSSSKDSYLLIGIGINLKNNPAEELRYSGNVANLLNINLMPLQLLERVLHYFDYWHDIFIRDGFHPIKNKWLQNVDLHYRDNIVVKIDNDHCTYKGHFAGIDSDGKLKLLLDPSKRIKLFCSGNVFKLQ